MAKYPEHDKLSAVCNESRAIGLFIEWLYEQGKCIEMFSEDADILVRDHTDIQKLLADFYKIDLNKLELEKRAMLEEIRSKNA